MKERKVALITGGATGIGRAIALSLASKDYAVVINYSRSEQEAVKTLHDVEQIGGTGFIYKADVSNDQDVRRMQAETLERCNRIDVVVNNAGTTDFIDMKDLEGITDEHWDRVMGVNAKGVLLVSRAFADQLIQSRGCIVNVASIAGMNGRGSSIVYSASKAAAISLTKSLALALAPDVRVNAVAPGIVQTRWVEGRDDHVRRLGGETPLGRVATAEDVAAVALSLITGSPFLTGQTIVVDGGKTI